MNKLQMSVLLAALAALPAGTVLADEAAVPEPVGKMTPPAGWNVDQGRSRGLEMSVARESHFGGAAIDISGQHLMAPSPGAMLLVTEIATRAVPSDPAAAGAAELQSIPAGVNALADSDKPIGDEPAREPRVKLVRWDVRADAAARVNEGTLEWTDTSMGTTTLGRTLVFQTREHLVRLTAECVIGNDAAAMRAPCEAALATLAPLAPVNDRVPLDLTAAPPLPTPPPGEEPPLAPGSDAIREHTGDLPVVINVDTPKPKPDRRPYFVGAGLLLIAAAYLWNRRMKERLKAEPAAAPESAPPADEPKPADAPKPDEDKP